MPATYTTWVTARAESEYYYELYVGLIGDKSGVDDDLDAFRHAYVSGVYAMERGETYANLLGWANELKGDLLNNQDPESKNMDLWNNKIGRDLSEISTSKADLAQKIATALSLGDLIIDPVIDTRSYTESPPAPKELQLQELKDNHSDGLEPDNYEGSVVSSLVDLASFLSNLVSQQNSAQDVVVRRSDPLILDLDGDGVELLTVANGVYWDLDEDDFAEQAGWVATDDGLLAFDANGDGVISTQDELFGNCGRRVYATGGV